MKYNSYSNQTNSIIGFKINSCGHIFARSGRIIDRPTGRNDWLLFYIAKGSEKFTLNGEIIANEGSFIIYKPNERQKHVCISKATSEFYYIHFSADDGLDDFLFKSSTIYHVEPSAEITNMFEKIIKETQLKKFNFEKICVFQFLELLSVLERKIKHVSETETRYDDKMAYVIQLMNLEYQNPRSLDEYAELCNMSKYHFLRIFQEITGSTPIEYRNSIRINRAKALLEDTSLPIQEIYTMVGYSSSSYFCDAFKKVFGMSPKQYREQLKEK